MTSPFKLKILVPTEQQVLNACLSYLRFDKRVAWIERFNVGAVKFKSDDGKPDRFVRFAFSGCPDLLGQIVDGRLLAVETKRPGGKLRAKQLEFLVHARKHNAIAIVASSVDDVIHALNEAFMT